MEEDGTMQIIVGRRYITRDGDTTSPIAIDPKPIAGQTLTATVGGIVRNWHPSGRWAPGHKFGLDLVSEAPA